MLFVHNLDDHQRTVRLADQLGTYDAPVEAFADADYGDVDLGRLKVNGWGYRWIRLDFVP
jgi:hypothetical protein